MFDFTKKKKYEKIVGVAKFGLSIDFSKDQSVESNMKGTWEVINFLKYRATNEPETQFKFISISNYWRLGPDKRAIFPENVKILDYGPYSGHALANKIIDNPESNDIQELWVFAGPVSRCNGALPGIKSRKGTDAKSMGMFQRYVGSILKLTNQNRFPWYHIITDNRYHCCMQDCVIGPTMSFGQSTEDYEYNWNHVQDANNLDKYVTETSKVKAVPIQNLWLIDKPEPDKIRKTKNVLVVANQIKEKDDPRYPMIKRFIVDNEIEAIILGRWPSNTYAQSFGNLLYSQEGVPASELVTISNQYKIGIIFNYDKLRIIKELNPDVIKKEIGWIPVKLIEMLYSGIIPIMVNFKSVPGFPKELCVKTPQELKQAIENISSVKLNPYELLKELSNKDVFYNERGFLA